MILSECDNKQKTEILKNKLWNFDNMKELEIKVINGKDHITEMSLFVYQKIYSRIYKKFPYHRDIEQKIQKDIAQSEEVQKFNGNFEELGNYLANTKIERILKKYGINMDKI